MPKRGDPRPGVVRVCVRHSHKPRPAPGRAHQTQAVTWYRVQYRTRHLVRNRLRYKANDHPTARGPGPARGVWIIGVRLAAKQGQTVLIEQKSPALMLARAILTRPDGTLGAFPGYDSRWLVVVREPSSARPVRLHPRRKASAGPSMLGGARRRTTTHASRTGQDKQDMSGPGEGRGCRTTGLVQAPFQGKEPLTCRHTS
jgi:hypothetical protein